MNAENLQNPHALKVLGSNTSLDSNIKKQLIHISLKQPN